MPTYATYPRSEPKVGQVQLRTRPGTGDPRLRAAHEDVVGRLGTISRSRRPSRRARPRRWRTVTVLSGAHRPGAARSSGPRPSASPRRSGAPAPGPRGRGLESGSTPSMNSSPTSIWPSSSRPGIGLPYGDSVGWSSSSSSRRSTVSDITCSQRHASSWTSSHSRPITSVSSRSASRCLRITRVARRIPSSVSSRCRSPSTVSSPSRSIRATVCDTVGPLWCSRSAIRARSGTMPSSTSS